MSNKRTTKEKILAILAVLVLFFLVGSLFTYIGLQNRAKTLKLQAEARARKAESEMRAKVTGMQIGDLNPEKITAKSYLTLAVSKNNFRKILTEKNMDDTLPIASVTKLMTAIVTLENIDLNTTVTATPDYVGGDGTSYILEIGKTYTADTLLNNMLISSDNDSAQLLSSILGQDNFVALMNKKTKELNLARTIYFNVTGLDPLEMGKPLNISSAGDLAELLIYIEKKYPKILQISKTATYDVCAIDLTCKNVVNTNKLLSDSDFKLPILGGKTGQTLLASKNLALIMEPFDDIFLINIVLGAEDHFADTKAILNHLENINI
jgi:D-alanyl-D-alanine carboxypeptidase